MNRDEGRSICKISWWAFRFQRAYSDACPKVMSSNVVGSSRVSQPHRIETRKAPAWPIAARTWLPSNNNNSTPTPKHRFSSSPNLPTRPETPARARSALLTTPQHRLHRSPIASTFHLGFSPSRLVAQSVCSIDCCLCRVLLSQR